MKYIEPPSEFIDKSQASILRDVAFEAELRKNLHDTQLALIYQQNLFNMYVPKELGGLELSLPEILRKQEGLSWADGSTSWVVTLCSGAAWFIGFLDPAMINEVAESDRVCFAGSGAVTGTATKISDGYEINGYWKYATGSLNATLFTVNCHIKEDGVQLYNTDGSPVVYAFLLKRNEVIVHNTWNGMGMVATGSHAFQVRQVRVPLNRSFIIDAAHAKLQHVIFKYPFLQLAETTLAVNLSGMACRFLDLCSGLLSNKVKNSLHTPDLLRLLTDSEARLNDVRISFYSYSDAAWDALVSESRIPDSMLAEVSHASYKLAHCSREMVNELYPYCGLAAADTRNEINRVWRNIHTAGQHSLFNVRNF